MSAAPEVRPPRVRLTGLGLVDCSTPFPSKVTVTLAGLIVPVGVVVPESVA